MALKLRRGTNAGRTAITPSEGEPIFTTDTKELYVGDGSTAGGIKITGGLADGDKGDVTVSSSGATWTIDNDAVSYAKMQNVSAASKLLGRGDSGSGDVQEITLGTGLTMTGTTLAASGGGGGSLGAPTYVVTKTADETVTDSTTLQEDDHLTWNGFVSGKSYWIELRMLWTRTNTSASPGIRYAFAGNSNGYSTNAIITDGTSLNSIRPTTEADIPRPIIVQFSIKASANFTGKVNWAQDSLQSGTGSVLLKGSQMLIWEVA